MPQLKLEAMRVYHPDFFRVNDLVHAYEQLNRTAFVFLVGFFVVPIVYLLAPTLAIYAVAVFLAGVMGYGISAVKSTADALDMPAWLLIALHIGLAAFALPSFFYMMFLVRLVRKSLLEFGIKPGTMSVDRAEMMAVQKLMIGRR
ncbi:MAG: hypothetical protein KF824_06750 [Fimbriimonadaceae bacterium]|nr:MAG: hypothetical protein KF824_06750 [Fimbriimonadaceae bacterium]